MDKTRLIRTKNTLLACCGALLLSAELVFGYFMGGLLISGSVLLKGLVVFWLINLGIVYIVASGVTERFKDPSLSVIQMFWAMSCSLFCLLLMPKYTNLIYILLFVITIFGVFRLRPGSFIRLALIQSGALGLIFGWLNYAGLASESAVELAATWFVYVSCMLILIILCRSMATLRSRLKSHNQQLLQAVSAREQFLANMSHEIRTPMNGVLGMLELIDTNKLNENQQRYINIARSSGQSLLVLINDILDYSKIEANKLELSPVRFDLKSAVYDFVDSFFFLAKQKGLEFIVDIDPNIPNSVLGDEARIRQVLNNVIGNALKFTNQGEIFVTVCVGQIVDSRLEIVIDVRDTGCGISDDAQARIFESFSQADSTTTREFGGTGLGLAISRKLCELMGGTIIVKSQQDFGSQFKLTMWVESNGEALQPQADLSDAYIFILEKNAKRAAALAKIIEYFNGRCSVLIGEDIDVNQVLATVSEHPVTHLICHQQLHDTEHRLLFEKLPTLPATSHVLNYVYGDRPEVDHECSDGYLSEPASEANVAALFQTRDEQKHSAHITSATVENIEPTISGHVLLVEDNKVNQEVAEMLLEDCGVDIDIADDGQIALDKLRENPGMYKIIFMDCQMPNMDGYTATRAIRSGEVGDTYIATPIIAMTANALAGDRDKCLDAGMSDYIAKPVNFDQVEAAVKKWFT